MTYIYTVHAGTGYVPEQQRKAVTGAFKWLQRHHRL